MICITNPEGIVEHVNHQFCLSTGYLSGEIIGQKPTMFTSEQKDEGFYRSLWETVATVKVWSGSIRLQRKDGKLFWARTTASPLFDNRGDIVNYLIVAEDITNELLAQQRLAESDKLAAIGTLAAGVAHEFKNYLAGIMGHASFALGELDDVDALEVAREALDQVVQLSESANKVAMSLLTYSRADTEKLLEEELTDIVNNSIALIEKEFKNHSIELVIRLEEVPRVIVSTGKIQQLLLNLLINAQHAIGSDGVISVLLNRTGEHARLVVADTGKGIPQENLSRVFDPFFSTKGVWGKYKVAGTGMGLSICRNIAREHGGDLTVESVVGVGTTFTLLLPIKTTASLSGRLANQPRYARIMVFSTDHTLAASLGNNVSFPVK
ncbi:MAG: PAS domain-containing protein [candidate division Zixibacteria bacterium]|nr:PAS domain-containing protein [candidate division Zixibacteria bacterium]